MLALPKHRTRSYVLVFVQYTLLTCIVIVISVSGVTAKTEPESEDAVIKWLRNGITIDKSNSDEVTRWYAEGQNIPLAVEHLNKMLLGRDKRVPLAMVAYGLQELATAISIPALIDGLSCEVEIVQIRCANALGRLKAYEAIGALEATMERGAGVRANVAGVLGDLQERGVLMRALKTHEWISGCIRRALANIPSTAPATNRVSP